MIRASAAPHAAGVRYGPQQLGSGASTVARFRVSVDDAAAITATPRLPRDAVQDAARLPPRRQGVMEFDEIVRYGGAPTPAAARRDYRLRRHHPPCAREGLS